MKRRVLPYILTPIIALGCSPRDDVKDAEIGRHSISAHEQIPPKPMGRPNPEYHFEGCLWRGKAYRDPKEINEVMRCPPDSINFFEEEGDSVNVVETYSYGNGTRTTFMADDDLKVTRYTEKGMKNSAVEITNENRETDEAKRIQAKFDQYLEAIKLAKK